MAPRRFLILLIIAGCGDSPADVDGGADATSPNDGGYEEPEFRPDRTGLVLLTEAEFAGFEIGLRASLRDRSDPITLELVARAGDCAVYHRPDPGYCEPSCTEGVCTPDNECAPFPIEQSAGVITMTGLQAPLAFEPGEYGYDVASDLELGDDLFATGAAVTATAPGDEISGFTLSATGVAPFESSVTSVIIHDGIDTTVTWTPEESGRIQLALRLGWHGSPATDVLLCETEDDGELTIPASLNSEMPYFEGGLFQVPSSFGRFDRAVTGSGGDSVELFIGNLKLIGFGHALPD